MYSESCIQNSNNVTDEYRMDGSVMKKNRGKISAKDIALVGMMVAVIEACELAMLPLPNVELTSFWIIMFTLYFRKKIVFVLPVFILLEGCLWGFGTWWFMYAYMWPALALITHLFRKNESAWVWGTISGIFGLTYGFFCAIPYVVMGAVGATLQSGLIAGFNWWVAGIPWDIVHGIGNFVLMLVLFKPVKAIMDKTQDMLANA